MTKEINLLIREAERTDAAELLDLLAAVSTETDYLVMDRDTLETDSEAEAFYLEQIAAMPNNIILLAIADEQIIGIGSIRASASSRVAHIGELGISILKEYWGFGIGSMLLEELLAWAEQSEIIHRMELTVQVRNQRAVALYKRFGFHIEATMSRGAVSSDGEFLDVYLMSKLLN